MDVPHKTGYLYEEGMILSPDGHCRAFDANAEGTVSGNGCGIVVLKRFEDALADRDCIYAVIRGSAVNNDGSMKVGFTAPSVDGQAGVIAEASAASGVDPGTITYIEAHGTGTIMGDPIEVAALTQAFHTAKTNENLKKGYCAIGSVKTNIGHLDAAAGVAGLIKTVLALKHKMIPPSLNYEQPNPKIDFADSPFYVNTKLSEWKADGTPSRAGVSSFGIGGTNAHVVLEEFEPRQPATSTRPWHLLPLSGKTPSALDNVTANLAEHLRCHPDLNLADVAYTLQVGRKPFSCRRIVVCQDIAASASGITDHKHILTNLHEPREHPVVFMFPGQGSQYLNMGLELYQTEPTFQEQVDLCSEILKPNLKFDLRHVLYPGNSGIEGSGDSSIPGSLNPDDAAQLALFVVEYALAKLWMEWGVHPHAMIGHSIGEYVGACLAGVFSLEDALLLVADRWQMTRELCGGAMTSVPLPENDIKALLHSTFPNLSVAVINSPSLCVVSGSSESAESLQNHLAEQGVKCQLLHVSHAFHSEMMDSVLEPFAGRVRKIRLNPPQIPYISNVTGDWITAADATDPVYWARHLRQTVRFAEGLQELLNKPEQILLEVGPGNTLGTLAMQQPNKMPEHFVMACLRHPKDNQPDSAFLLTSLGRLWLAGVKIDWSGFHAHEPRCRLPLPTYPFERKRFWIEPLKSEHQAGSSRQPAKKPDIADWFYFPLWKQSASLGLISQDMANQKSCWMVFADESGVGRQLVNQLEQKGQDIITVKPGSEFAKTGDSGYVLNPEQQDDYDTLFSELAGLDRIPGKIVHLWSVTPDTSLFSDIILKTGFHSLLFLAQAVGKLNHADESQITVVSNNIHEVTGEEIVCPGKATMLGPVKVMSQEYPGIICRCIDILIPASEKDEQKLANQLITELAVKSPEPVVAYRGKYRWNQTFEPIRFEPGNLQQTTDLREKGVYLITGGLGSIGLVLAEYLAKAVKARLILTGRSSLPGRDEWDEWLAAHEERDRISIRIRKIRELEDIGSEVFATSADAANQEQMQEAVTRAEEQFGLISGVFHAAGITGEKAFQTIGQLNKSDCEQQFQPKLHGVLVLEQVLKDRKLDFCLLLSSLTSVLGGIGSAAYSAANIFMDAFAYRHNQTGSDSGPWISVNWETWQLEYEKEQSLSPGSTLVKLAVSPQEGLEAFRRILSVLPVPQVIVSSGDLQTRINQWIKREFTTGKDFQQPETLTAHHGRPNLQNVYVAPRNKVEQTITELLQASLGIEQIGVHDSFFDLGGHSLLAIQFLSKVREIFHTELSVQTLFDRPTVAQIAESIEDTCQITDDDSDEIRRIPDLSEKDAIKLLNEQQGSEPTTADSISVYSDFDRKVSPGEVKLITRQFYNSITQQLDSTIFGKSARFLNYGYVADGTPQYAAVDLPEHALSANSVKLIIEAVGDCDLTNCRILDIGCGRGGNIEVMAEYFNPAELIGMDLSSGAVSFCNANNTRSNAHFLEGDAEKLPFGDNMFDMITNIESSHNYPDMLAFYTEVCRVLKKDGYFIYSDLLPSDMTDDYLSVLQEMGFILDINRDITNNVLLSCDETAGRHLDAFDKDNDAELIGNFLAVPGSKPYEGMKHGTSAYRIFRLKKKMFIKKISRTISEDYHLRMSLR